MRRDRIARLPTGRGAIAIGFGSTIDISGIATYRTMSRLLENTYTGRGPSWRRDLVPSDDSAHRESWEASNGEDLGKGSRNLGPDEPHSELRERARREPNEQDDTASAIALPSAFELAEYKQVDTSLPDRIFQMAHREQEHQMQMEALALKQPYILARRGQVFGLTSLLLMVGLAVYLAYLHQPGWAVAIGALDFAAVVAVFVAGRDFDDQRRAPRTKRGFERRAAQIKRQSQLDNIRQNSEFELETRALEQQIELREHARQLEEQQRSERDSYFLGGAATAAISTFGT